jgi:cephalosporin-C deacetylase-like acetyl esterase
MRLHPNVAPFGCLTAMLVFPALGFGQALEAKAPFADQLVEINLKNQTQRISSRFLDGARTLQEWQDRRERLRREYFDMLGLNPLPQKTPLKATVTGTVEHAGVVIEKLHYQSRPGLYVTANLYRPTNPVGRLPAILYLCGHSAKGRDGNKTAFQDHGLWFASNGYVCLMLDTLQLGELAGKHHGTYNLGRWWWHARGYTPAGVECWNGIRGLDYLLSRSDVDPARLGVTGISGGGASTFWVAAADERVKVAVPVSGMSDLESYVSNKVINGHCDCMFLINTYGWEWTTIAALIAPRPLLFANSDHDPIFPMDGNRRVIARLRQLYTMYGKPELIDDYVSKGGHDYRPDLRLAIFQWFNKHLKNETSPVKDAEFKLLPGAALRVFPEDKELPADAVNSRIDETFVSTAAVRLPDRAGFTGWRQELLQNIRDRCFRDFPQRIPAAKLPEAPIPGVGFLVSTEPGIVCNLTTQVERDAPGLLLVLNEDETPGDDVPAWARQFAKGRDVRMLSVRGGKPLAWTRKSPPNYVERAHALLGRTVDQRRVWDIAAVARMLSETDWEKKQWAVAGRGPAGILAAYAALFELSIPEVLCVEPSTSHSEGPYFLGILRVLDVPEALGLLAPRTLRLTAAKNKAFDRTEAIFRLARAADSLHRE